MKNVDETRRRFMSYFAGIGLARISHKVSEKSGGLGATAGPEKAAPCGIYDFV